MKKHLLFLMLFAGSILAFTSCKKDEDATLEGIWKLTKYKSLVYENNVLIETEEKSAEEDNSVTYFAFSGNQWIRYSDDVPAYQEDQTFVYSNDMLMLYEDGELKFELRVKTLNGRTLVFSQEDTSDYEGVSRRGELEYTFEKR